MFNKSRGTLPRPKVCKESDPHLPPAPTNICDAFPKIIIEDPTAEFSIELKAFSENMAPSQPVATGVVTELSTVVDLVEPDNVDAFTGHLDLEGPEEDGSETVTVTFTFDDETTCVTLIQITYQETED